MTSSTARLLGALTLTGALLTACAPAAPANPTAAPKPTEAPKPAAPAASPTAASAASPAAVPKPAASPSPSPSPSPAAAGAVSFNEQAVADFYRGKTIRIVVGFGPGGPFDVYSRLIAKYLPQYLPGNPSVVVESKPGAGSLLAANMIYGSEAKDGTVIGNFHENNVLQQAIQGPGVQFDAAKLQWIGSAVKTTNACLLRTDLGVNSFQDATTSRELAIASTGPGSNTYQVPKVLASQLGAKFNVVSGYDGTAKTQLAVESKEADGMCTAFDAIASVHQGLFDGNPPIARVVVVMSSQPPDHPVLKGVPTVESLAKSDEAKQLLRAVDAPAQMAKPYAVAPEVPADRVAALRRAIGQAMANPQLKAEAAQAKLEVTPGAGEEVQRLVQQLLSLPPNLLAKLKTIID